MVINLNQLCIVEALVDTLILKVCLKFLKVIEMVKPHVATNLRIVAVFACECLFTLVITDQASDSAVSARACASRFFIAQSTFKS